MILSTALIGVMLAVVTHLKVLVAYHCEALFLVHVAVESACSRLVDNFVLLGGRVIQGFKLLPSSDAFLSSWWKGKAHGGGAPIFNCPNPDVTSLPCLHSIGEN